MPILRRDIRYKQRAINSSRDFNSDHFFILRFVPQITAYNVNIDLVAAQIINDFKVNPDINSIVDVTSY